MARSWLKSVAILASGVAVSICSIALADNKGMNFGGGSFRSSGGALPGGSISRGSVAPRAVGNVGGVSGGGFSGGSVSWAMSAAGTMAYVPGFEHQTEVVLVDRLGNEGDVPAPRKPEEVDAIFFELDALLDRTGELTEHTAKLLEELGKD